MAIKKTTDGKGDVSIKDAYIVRQLIVIKNDGTAEISARLYKDQATYDADVSNFNNEVKHDVTGTDLATLLAGNASKGIEKLADDFLKATAYPGAIDA